MRRCTGSRRPTCGTRTRPPQGKPMTDMPITDTVNHNGGRPESTGIRSVTSAHLAITIASVIHGVRMDACRHPPACDARSVGSGRGWPEGGPACGT